MLGTSGLSPGPTSSAASFSVLSRLPRPLSSSVQGGDGPLLLPRCELRALGRKQGYTGGMKTAISIDDSLLEKVDALAAEWRLPRSRVFALAAKELIRKHEDEAILDALNRAYEDDDGAGDELLARARRRSHRRQVEGEW